MSNPVYFTVVADFRAFIEDASSDSDYDPQIVPVGGTVTFTPLVNAGDVVLATQTSPRPIGFIPSPVTAIIDPADGRLKLRKTADSGASGSLGFAPVRLLADSAVLELDSPLFYSVSFSDVVFSNNRRGSITGFTFQAPNTDTEINLITVARQPGQPASGITKIAPGAVRLASNGTDIIFSFAGVDLDQPVSLAGVTGPTGATGAAATIAVGTVQTGSPGSNATVTNGGSSGAAVLNFTIPRGDVGATGAQGPTGAQGIQGQPGVSLDIQGTVSTYANLPSNPVAGDAYLVASEGLLYYFDGTSWPSAGNGVPFVGPQGPVGAQGIQGIQGEQGIQGPVGASGPVGATGAAATVAVGTVQTGSPGSSVTVTNSGSSGAAVLDFTIPRGDVGATGPAGQAANILGSVATYANLPGASGLADGDAYVVAADGRLYIFDGSAFPADGAGVPFVGPAGATGPAGPVGATGASGLTGGTGAPGTPGASGAPGTTSWNGITDKPSTFTPSAHTHVAADISDSSSVGRSVLTAADAAAARSAISAENTASKGAANGYASLDSNGRVPAGQLPNSIMTYNGLYDVVANSPALSDATGDAGDVYRISVAGTRNFGSGNITLEVGDYLIHSGSVFQKADTTDAVSTVAGRTGDVTLTKSDVGLGDVDNTADANKNVLSASKLTTARTINGVSFDGTANITVPAGIQRVVQTITAPTTLGAAANTDYVYFCGGIPATETNTVALLHGNGTNNSTTFTDSSALQANWNTLNGSPVVSTAQSRFGGASLFFNGSSSIIPTAPSTNFSWGTGDFTIEMWVRPSAMEGVFLDGRPLGEAGTATSSFGINSNGSINYFTGSGTLTSAVGALTLNTWAHVAVSRSGTSTRLFVNGTQSGSTFTDSTNYTHATGRPVLGGRGDNTVVNYFSGHLDDVRFTRGLARYTANFTVPSTAFPDPTPATFGTPTLPTAVGNTNHYTLKNTNTAAISVLTTSGETFPGNTDESFSSVSVLLHGDGATIVDSSPNNATFAAGGNARISTAQSKFGGSSLLFDSSNSLLTTANSSAYAMGSGNFTLETWVYPTSGTGMIMDTRNTNGSASGICVQLGNNALEFYSDSLKLAAGSVPNNQWSHVAFVRSGTTITGYVNGTSVGSFNSSQNFSDNTLVIGTNQPRNFWLTGYLDELRITKVARYTGNFSVPTSAFPDSSPTSIPIAASATVRFISNGSKWHTV